MSNDLDSFFVDVERELARGNQDFDGLRRAVEDNYQAKISRAKQRYVENVTAIRRESAEKYARWDEEDRERERKYNEAQSANIKAIMVLCGLFVAIWAVFIIHRVG